MFDKDSIVIMLITSMFLTGIAAESFAQQSRTRTIDPILRGNPKRDAGGSCVYDRDGKVVFAPEGKECRDRRNHLTELEKSESDLIQGFPPAMQQELARLLGDHDHIADEIARLRHAIRNEDRNVALEAAEKVSSELTDHTAREERFLEGLARRTMTR